MTTPDSMTKHDNAALEQIFTDAESADADIFAEMRSNLLLVAGEHYTKKQAAFFSRLRDSKELNDQQKLRLTKNHIQKISKTYVNNIISMAPGVGFEPKNESELQDQKAAELHHAVWKDACEKYTVEEMIEDWADDFVNIGEVACKIFWDDSLNEFIFEPIHGFNLLRPAECKDIKKAGVLIVRKMVNKNDLLKQFQGKEKFINESMDETLMVFDANKNGYRKAGKDVMVKEYFFRACAQYPQGYFYITTKEGILAEGELPGGIFPIIIQPFEKIQTTPRGRSAIKHMRPYQAEINRAASKMAEHQITLGDDKLIIQNGQKVTSGMALPGVRSINVTGGLPTVLAGRDGSQYLAYMQAQIEELYRVMNVEEDSAESSTGQLDPYALLFRSASQKKKFQRYIKRFERFLIEVARTYIKLAKLHLSDDAFVQAVGRKEAVNIAEFRAADDLCYQIKITAQTDDIETKMGKQLVLNHLVQYTGAKLDKEDIGKLVRLMPYANMEEGMADLTIDYDSATNDILALDRGELPPIHEYDNHIYMIKRLVGRVRQADFPSLDPMIQRNYAMRIQAHQQGQVEIEQKLQAAKDGFIPTGGYMVTCDLYVTDPADPTKERTKRARLPYEALQWLIKRLETQGQSLDQLEQMNQGALAQMSTQMLQAKQGMPADGMAAQPQMA
jgi:hypothetical protein